VGAETSGGGGQVMKCRECGCHETTIHFDRHEVVCNGCGHVKSVLMDKWTKNEDDGKNTTPDTWNAYSDALGSHIFSMEARRTKSATGQMNRMRNIHRRKRRTRRSMDKFQTEIAMVLSRYSTYQSKDTKLLQVSLDNYKRLQEHHKLDGISLEQRAAALSYYVLKELGYDVNLRHHSKITLVEAGTISRISKRIAKFFRNPQVFAQNDAVNNAKTILEKLLGVEPSEFRESCISFVAYVERLLDAVDERMTNNLLVATVWIASRLEKQKFTQEEICSLWPSSIYGMRKGATYLCEKLGIDRKELATIGHGYEMNKIIGGIRI